MISLHQPSSPGRPVKLAILSSLPVEAASTRYRIAQYLPHLEAEGIRGGLHSFIRPNTYRTLYRRDHAVRTAAGVIKSVAALPSTAWALAAADVVWVEREAAPLGPPLLEWLARRGLRRPMILDLDDAMHLRGGSAVYGRWLTSLKCAWKTERSIAWADYVFCGNPNLLRYVRETQGTRERSSFIPTAIDTRLLKPRPHTVQEEKLTLGWIGSHSTAHLLEAIVPVLESLAARRRLRLRVVGAGRPITVEGMEVENLSWNLDREARDFEGIDIGLYPLKDTEVAAGKSGFKAIQYMACGIPFVASPVGIVGEITGESGLLARSPDEWRSALERLVESPALRQYMGAAGRVLAVERFDLRHFVPAIARVVRRLAAVQ